MHVLPRKIIKILTQVSIQPPCMPVCQACTINWKICTINPQFSLEIFAIICVSVQQQPARYQLLKLTSIALTKWGKPVANSTTPIKYKIQMDLYVGMLLLSNEIWIIHVLTHLGRVTHICVSKLTIIGSDNGLSPDRLQAIIWTNVGLLLIGPWGTNFGEIFIEILTFSFKKMRLKMSSANDVYFVSASMS